MRTNRFIRRNFVIILLAMMLMCASITAFAANDAKIMASQIVDDQIIRMYIRNGNVGDDAKFQIGNIPIEKPVSYSISEDQNPMRTLIMVDNSLSISVDSREKLLDLLDEIVNNHSENELFRLATFSTTINYLSDRYSDDYTAIHNTISNIAFHNQDTMLTDVLYGVIDDLNVEGYSGYTRIIIFTDGVNNKPVGGKTLDIIKDMLDNNSYPIYTVGSDTGSNSDLLDNLFSLSWKTGCEYNVLEKSSISDIAADISKDNSIVVYDAIIPDEIKVGDNRKAKLTFGDGTELVLDVQLPFSIISEETQPETNEEIIEETAETEAETNEIIEDYQQEHEQKSELPVSLVIGVIVIILIVVGIIIYLIVRNKKKQEDNTETSDNPNSRVSTEYYEEETDGRVKTEVIDERTSAFSPGSSRTVITLTDKDNTSISKRSEIIDELTIGRDAGNNIRFDDTRVHGRHCRLQDQGGDYYIIDIDLGKKRNHTRVNGQAIEVEVPYVVKSGDEITIGSHTYVLDIEKV